MLFEWITKFRYNTIFQCKLNSYPNIWSISFGYWIENMPISNKKSDKLSLFNETEFVKRIKWKLVFVSLPERKEKKKKTQVDLIRLRQPSKMIDYRNLKKNISSILPEIWNLLDNDLQIKLKQYFRWIKTSDKSR